MKDFYATSFDDSFESPCFTFGYNQAISMARALGHKYIAKVLLGRNGAFEYSDADYI